MSHHTMPESKIGQAAGILMAVTQNPETPQIVRELVGPHVDALFAIAGVMDLLGATLTNEEAKAAWLVLNATFVEESDERVVLGDFVRAREKLRQIIVVE